MLNLISGLQLRLYFYWKRSTAHHLFLYPSQTNASVSSGSMDFMVWGTGAEPQNMILNQQPSEPGLVLFRLVIVSSLKGNQRPGVQMIPWPLQSDSSTGNDYLTLKKTQTVNMSKENKNLGGFMPVCATKLLILLIKPYNSLVTTPGSTLPLIFNIKRYIKQFVTCFVQIKTVQWKQSPSGRWSARFCLLQHEMIKPFWLSYLHAALREPKPLLNHSSQLSDPTALLSQNILGSKE